MIPSEPTFTTVPKSSSAGDFLGMGAISERLYGGVFPGLNNNVRHIRPYAAICWMVYKLRERAFSNGDASIGAFREDTKLGIWKIQLLLNWVAKLDGLKGYPGVDRFESDPSVVELQQESWSMVKISFWDTAWYKPSLLNGLCFLIAHKEPYHGTYSCTEAGEALAKAYDHEVRALGASAAQWLADPHQLRCTKKRLQTLRPVLELENPSKRERDTFMQQFFKSEFDRRAGGRNRRSGLILALRTLHALEEEATGTTMEDIRHAMAAGYTPGGYPIDDVGVQRVRLKWSILQVRALQRLAMESLLALVERQILLAEQTCQPREIEDIAETIAAYVNVTDSDDLYPSVRGNYEWAKTEQGAYETLQAAGLVHGNEFLEIATLKAALRGGVGIDESYWRVRAQRAIWALIVCAIEAENLSKVNGARELLEWDAGKLSLAGLCRVLVAHMNEPIEKFARHVVRHLVIDQHLNVATERSTVALDGKQRFVFSPERGGLARFAEARGTRFVGAQESGDILFNALLLLENCGKLRYAPVSDGPAYTNRLDGTFTLTKAGRTLLAEAG